jgi:DNA polymerase-1
MNYIIIDLETNNREIHGRKGNPWHNEIIAVGMADKDQVSSKYIYPDKLKSLDLDGYDLIVGHNCKYDLLYLWHLDDLQDFFKRNGKIWDTQYAEYVLSGHQNKYPSLRDTAVNVYKLPERSKNLEDMLFNKKLINNYGLVSDLPKEAVIEDVENDVRDTRSIYLAQVERAKKLGMETILELEMDAILATTEMEYNGMYIDQQVLQKNKALLQKELEDEYNKLRAITEKYWRAM